MHELTTEEIIFTHSKWQYFKANEEDSNMYKFNKMLKQLSVSDLDRQKLNFSLNINELEDNKNWKLQHLDQLLWNGMKL
jgi:hypothetical protein